MAEGFFAPSAVQLNELLGASIDTSIEDGQHLLKHVIRSPPDALGLPCTEINRFDLLNHDESRDIWIVHNSHMEGKAPIRVGEGAHDGETCMFVEQVVAYNQGRPAAFLLMPRLRVKGDGDEVTFLRDVSCHLPVLSANWPSPVNFLWPIILRDARHQFTQALFTSHVPYGSNDNQAVSRGNINRIANRDVSLLKDLLSKAEPLAVAPFLNLSDHILIPHSLYKV